MFNKMYSKQKKKYLVFLFTPQFRKKWTCSIHGRPPFWTLYVCTPARFFLSNVHFLYVKSTSMVSPFRASLHESRCAQIQYIISIKGFRHCGSTQTDTKFTSWPWNIKKKSTFQRGTLKCFNRKEFKYVFAITLFPVTIGESVTASQPTGQWYR